MDDLTVQAKSKNSLKQSHVYLCQIDSNCCCFSYLPLLATLCNFFPQKKLPLCCCHLLFRSQWSACKKYPEQILGSAGLPLPSMKESYSESSFTVSDAATGMQWCAMYLLPLLISFVSITCKCTLCAVMCCEIMDLFKFRLTLEIKAI